MEGSTAWLSITFKDRLGVVQQPVSATYRVDDVTSGTQIRGDTAITGLAPTVLLVLTPSDNIIVDAARAMEKRRVTIKSSFGASDAHNEQFDYLVKNLSNVP